MLYHLALLDGSVLEFNADNDSHFCDQVHTELIPSTVGHTSQIVLMPPPPLEEVVEEVEDEPRQLRMWRCFLTPRRRFLLATLIAEGRVHACTSEDLRYADWAEDCTNDSILTYLLSLPEPPLHLFANPHPLTVDHVLEYLVQRVQGIDYPYLIPALRNPNDRIVDYFLSEKDTVDTFPNVFVRNQHSRVGEWIDSYAIKHKVWTSYSFLNYLIHPHVSYETLTQLLSHIPASQFVMEVWNMREVRFPEALQRAVMDIHGEFLTREHTSTTSVLVLVKCGRYNWSQLLQMPSFLWNFLFDLPEDEIVDMWISTFSQYPHEGGVRKTCAANPHPRMVRWVMDTLRTLESDPKDLVDEVSIQFLLGGLVYNPHPDAVAYVTERWKQGGFDVVDLCFTRHAFETGDRKLSFTTVMHILRFTDVEVLF